MLVMGALAIIARIEIHQNSGPNEDLLRRKFGVDANVRVGERFRSFDDSIAFSGGPARQASHLELLQDLHCDNLLFHDRELLADATTRPRRGNTIIKASE